MSQPAPFSEHVMHLARQLGVDTDEQRAHFAGAADYIEREVIRQFATSFPEILSVAQKNAANGAKPAKASLALSVEIDVSNIEMLNLKISSSVSPWKQKDSGECTEDLRQFAFDFEAGTAMRNDEAQAPDEEAREEGTLFVANGTATELYSAEELGAKGKKELRTIGEAKGLTFKARDTAETMVAAIIEAQNKPAESSAPEAEAQQEDAA